VSLAVIVDHVSIRLAAGLDGDTTVGDVAPTSADQVPAVTLDLDDVTSVLGGIGRIPRGTRTGALPVTSEIDLADPVLDLGDGESLTVVSADRLSVVLPHGPLVRADGAASGTFTAADLTVRDTAPWQVVSGTPSGRQLRPDPDAGLLHLGEPLPVSGTLHLEYRIGAWDSTVSRFQGRLRVRVIADGADISALVRMVADVLASPDPGIRLAPLSWGAAGRTDGAPLPDDVRVQDLTFRVDAEVEQPLLPTGGGVISKVAVALRAEENGVIHHESFDVRPRQQP
jgi:hypothetical protein